MTQSLREDLAAVQHEIWSHWMKYLFRQLYLNDRDSFVVPTSLASRWMRQMDTKYRDLSEPERESDRHQADKVLAILDELEEA